MEYDGVGNRLSMIASLPGVTGYSGTTQYTYNSEDELTQETSTRLGSYTNSFGYDSAFNPTTFRGAANTFNADNQNTADTFDGNGNPTAYNGTTLTFDPENRMTAYGTAMTAGYRADGLRAWKSNETTNTYFIYDGIVPVCEVNSSGTVTACNTFGAEGLLSRHTSGGSVFYAFDPQGNPAERLNANDTVLGSYAFDAFGARSTTDTSPDVYSGFEGADGYYSDGETGLELAGYRYYDETAGRFVTRDPVSYAGGVNVYGYVGNDPQSEADPAGLFHMVVVIGSDGLGSGQIIADPGDIVPIGGGIGVGIGPGGTLGSIAIGGEQIGGPFPVGNYVGPKRRHVDPKKNKGYGPFPPGTWPIIGVYPTSRKLLPAMGPQHINIGNPGDPPGYRKCRIHSGRCCFRYPTGGCLRISPGTIGFIIKMIKMNPGGNNALCVVQE
ncbi:MAG TPA: RHS repeat-associated core domain-containing protein [Chthonomonadales bacterium]|nr:RHS repeat-associated core domain-containing protein [Chthonomonadales bacterium]